MNAHITIDKLIATPAGPLPASVAATGAHPATGAVAGSGRTRRWREAIEGVLGKVMPPLVVLLVLVIVWELSCSGPKSALPAPTKIWMESRDLIMSPFFINGPQDIGLGWRVLTSLQRVAI
ncbi:MAG: nitrate ABC transporter, permease protein, partial [Hyphomicrobium sp.]